MKLFDQIREPKAKLGDVVCITTEDETVPLETDSIEDQVADFNKHVNAFNSLNVIDEQIASENYNFIDKGNYVLYNEYIKSITSNLKMDTIPVISQESISTLSTTALNHHIALEGFIGDIWKKIKEIFSKIFNGIKEFFKKYFTRLGRIKNKLKNLSEVLTETDKNLSKPMLDNVPGGLAAKYPFKGGIDSALIIEVLNNTKLLTESMNEINNKAEKFISKDILDKNFIANMTRLKQDIESSKNQIESNKSDKGSYTEMNGKSIKDTFLDNREINKNNKSLSSDIKEKSKQLDSDESTVSNITGKEINLDEDDVKADEARKEFAEFIKTLVSTLDKVKGKNLIKGKNIKSVKGDAENGLEIESEDLSDDPNSIKLDTKNVLLKIVKDTIVMIETAEKLTGTYGKINDSVMDNMNKVDKLIMDLDKTDDAKLGKYKKLLNTKIKMKLNLVKTFFNNYNKVCKNILEMGMDCGDGVVEYSVLSLKNFG